MKKIFIIILLFNFMFSFSQTGIIVKKQIIDKTNNSPIPFVNVYVKGLFTGTYTDDSGYFTLRLPVKSQNDTLIISCIGYEICKIKISEIDTSILFLTQKTNMLQEVAIVSEYNPQLILEKAYKKRKKNYSYTKPYCAKTYYREYFQINNKTTQMLEMLVSIKEKGMKYNPFQNSEFNIDTISSFYRSDYQHIWGSFSIVGLMFYDKIYRPKQGSYHIDSVFFNNTDKYISITFIPEKTDTIVYESYKSEIIDFDNQSYIIQKSPEQSIIQTDRSYQYLTIEHYIINLSDYAIVNYSSSYNLLGKPEKVGLAINKFYTKTRILNIHFRKHESLYFPEKISSQRDRVFVTEEDLNKIDYEQNSYREYIFNSINTNCNKRINKYKDFFLEDFLAKYKNKIYINTNISVFDDKKRKEYLDKITGNNIIN